MVPHKLCHGRPHEKEFFNGTNKKEPPSIIANMLIYFRWRYWVGVMSTEGVIAGRQVADATLCSY